MYNLSELIKTDCCIDCGTNEKLREVVGKMTIEKSYAQWRFGVKSMDIFLSITDSEYTTFINPTRNNPIPLTSINIDL